MLKLNYIEDSKIEVGCDEAGRGCLAGPVFAAAVILPNDFSEPLLNDSKKLSAKNRSHLRTIIEEKAIDFAIGILSNEEIDKLNILNASIAAMHNSLDKLNHLFHRILVDGNRFHPYKDINHVCIVEGDAKLMPIAAASVLAKTYRDEFMAKLSNEYPNYDWGNNKGYPTPKHKQAIIDYGITPYHRKSFKLNFQTKLNL